jgi:hypothetical protein
VTASTIFFQLIHFFAKVPTTSTFFYANPYITLHCLPWAFSSKTNHTYGLIGNRSSHTEFWVIRFSSNWTLIRRSAHVYFC